MGSARIIIDKNCKVFTRVCTPLSFEVINKKLLHDVTFAFKLSGSQHENHFLALYVFHFTNFTNLSFLNDFYVPWTQIKTNYFLWVQLLAVNRIIPPVNTYFQEPKVALQKDQVFTKEVEIVYRLFLVHVLLDYAQPASHVGGLVIH